MKLLNKRFNPSISAFTIVELLIVIVVIGILVTISVLTYSGISSRANVATIQSDLDSNSRKLQLYYSLYNSYPTTLDANKCPSAPTADTNYCIKLSTNNTVNTYSATASTYTLNIANGSLCYQVTESTTPTNACTAGTSTYAVVSTGGNNIQTYVANGVDGISGQSYKYHTFTSSGTLTVTSAGFADVVVVGGGGSGGTWGASGAAGYGGGGGGSGGCLNLTNAYLPVGTWNVVIGVGGTGPTVVDQASKGNASSLGFLSAIGDGAGNDRADPSLGQFTRMSGGSGGGGASGTFLTAGSAEVAFQGNNGGVGVGAGGTGARGGGGGCGAVGAAAVGTAGGSGGAGISTTIAGSNPTGAYVAGSYSFGGGGGGSGSGTSGAGGSGGGGAGSTSGAGSNGTANTGGGGGGAGNTGKSGNGGSGIVIVRVRL